MISFRLRSLLRPFPDFCFNYNYATQIQGLNNNSSFLNVSLKNCVRGLCSETLSPACEEKPTTVEKVKFTLVKCSAERVEVEGDIGESVMNVAVRHEADIEGCCDGGLNCATCHVYVDENTILQIPPASEKENDVLDNTLFLKSNSRLSCQIQVNKDVEGACFTVVPKPV